MRGVTYNPAKLTTASAVLRKVAEVIQHGVKHCSPGYFEGREGACSAFVEVEWGLDYAIRQKHQIDRHVLQCHLSEKSKQKLNASGDTVERARELFKQHFGMTGNKRPKPRKGWWWGREFTDEQQHSRIHALLTAAEIAEDQGD